MAGEITREEFTLAGIKCDEEAARLESEINSMEMTQEDRGGQRRLMEVIACTVEELTGGVEYEDEFYGHLLDRVVVHDKNHIDVYLKELPWKWSYQAD